MANRRRFSIERRISVYTKEWGVESGNNLATSWYTSSRIWKKMENDRVGNKKLLVDRSNERYRKICK